METDHSAPESTAPTYRSLRVTHEESIAEVVLIGPGKGNAMGPDFWRELPQAFAALDQDEAIRAIIIRGEGQHFSYGLDLPTMLAEPEFHVTGANLAAERTCLHDTILRLQAAITSVATCRKPVIAAISGWCIGGGLDLIAACDIRLCSANARFSLREVRVAIVADLGSLQRLPHIIGEGHTRELALTSPIRSTPAAPSVSGWSMRSSRRPTPCSSPPARPPTRSPPTHPSSCRESSAYWKNAATNPSPTACATSRRGTPPSSSRTTSPKPSSPFSNAARLTSRAGDSVRTRADEGTRSPCSKPALSINPSLP